MPGLWHVESSRCVVSAGRLGCASGHCCGTSPGTVRVWFSWALCREAEELVTGSQTFLCPWGWRGTCLAGSNTLLGLSCKYRLQSCSILLGEVESTLGPWRETLRASCLPIWLLSPFCEPSMSCCLSLQSLSIVGLFVLWPGCKSAGKFRSQKDLSGPCLSSVCTGKTLR